MARLDQFPVHQAPRTSRVFSVPGTVAERWNALLVGGCGLTVLLLGYRHRWTNDDALIYTRAVRQILAGHGPVYNVGERAESSTGTLWQWMLTAAALVSGVDPLLLAVGLGLLLTVAGFLFALDGTRRLWRLRRRSGVLLPAGVLLLLPLRATWDYSTSGLETGLTFAWLGLSWWLLVRGRPWVRAAFAPDAGVSGQALPVTAFVFGLGPLVRPDLALVSAVFLVALWLMRRPTFRTTLYWACAAGALPLAYEIFRAGYYGVLVPLPGIAKEASGTQWQYGLDYLRNTVVPYYLWVPLLLMAAFAVYALTRWRARTRPTAGWPLGRELRADAALLGAPVLAGLLSAFFVVKVGGDFMHGRMVLPALFLVMLPVFLLPATLEARVLVGGLGVWAVLCGVLCRPPFESPEPRIVYDSHTVYVQGLDHAHPVNQATHAARPLVATKNVRRAQRLDAAHGTRSAVVEMNHRKGMYATVPLSPRVKADFATAQARLGNSGATVPLDALAVDTLGLANPLGAHTLPTRHYKAGHEKPLHRAWILADLTAPDTPPPAGVDPRQVAAARHAMTCGRLAELQASVRDPMTPGRFARNLANAWDRTHFRIPADPLKAERKVCAGT